MHWAWCTPWGGIRRSSGSSCRDMSRANWEPWWFLQEFKAKKMWRTWFNVRFEFWFLVFLKRFFLLCTVRRRRAPYFWSFVLFGEKATCFRQICLPAFAISISSSGDLIALGSGDYHRCLVICDQSAEVSSAWRDIACRSFITYLVFEVAFRLDWHFHHQRTLIISTEHTHPYTPWQDVRPRLPKLAEHVHQVKCHLEFLLVSIRCCNQQSCCHHHR